MAAATFSRVARIFLTAGERVTISGAEAALDLEAEAPVLALEERLLAGLVHAHGQLVEVRRLGQVVEGPEAHGLRWPTPRWRSRSR